MNKLAGVDMLAVEEDLRSLMKVMTPMERRAIKGFVIGKDGKGLRELLKLLVKKYNGSF